MECTDYLCEISDFSKSEVTLRIKETVTTHTEPPFFAAIFQALPKGDKFDTIIQKSVECGASMIVPFESERCVVRAKSDSEQKKLERRSRISLEAAKQCGRGIVPEVKGTVSFKEAVDMAASYDIAIICYEGESGTSESLKKLLQEKKAACAAHPTVSIMIGSEGGFSPSEVEYATGMGLCAVGLGNRILRTETASSFALSCLVYEFEM
jgi:16S rRNA (uracil1498-N3)-methyltransferase